MLHGTPFAIDCKSPPFDQLKGIHPLATNRGGHGEHARHHLVVGRDKRTRASVLVKLTSKPGLVYERNINNEIASLSTVNRELPASPYFPLVIEHGRLPDGRVYLMTALFAESPLATAIDTERMPARMVAHLKTAIEVATALTDLHRLKIFHVDLNPMNILRRVEHGRPVIRIVDFESSYEATRHSAGEFYDPPTTPGYAAPEVSRHAPDARADLFSLGAVLYTMLAGYGWTWQAEPSACVEADHHIDRELKDILVTALDTNPDRRYRSMSEFHAVLAAYLERIWPGRRW